MKTLKKSTAKTRKLRKLTLPPTVEANLGLVRRVCRRYAGNGRVEDTDQYADGLIGLLHAVENYDPSLGFAFSTYATKCIKNAVFQGYRDYTYDNLGDEGDELEMPEVDVLQRYLTRIDINELFGDNAEDQRAMSVLRRYYLNGENWRQIGESLGVGTSNSTRQPVLVNSKSFFSPLTSTEMSE